MASWLSRILGVLCAVGGAVLWGIGLAVLAPPPEPNRTWRDVWAAYESSLAQDVRWLGILVTLLGLVLVVRGERSASARYLTGTVAWLGLDVCLDRFGVAGSRAAVPIAVVAVVLSLVAAVILVTVRRPRSTDRRVLVFAGVVAAAMLPLTAMIEVPDGRTPQVSPASCLALGLLMGAAVVGCAVAAAPRLEGVRWWLAAGLAVAVVAGPPWLTAQTPWYQTAPALIVAVVAVTGVVALAWDRPVSPLGWVWYPIAAGGVLVVYPAVFVLLLTQAGAPFVLCGLVAAIVLGVLASRRVRESSSLDVPPMAAATPSGRPFSER
jgi:hypothetical protein